MTADAFSKVGPAVLRFSRTAQNVMSSTASNYDISRLCLGLLITLGAALLVSPAVYQECVSSAYTGAFLAFMVLGYGGMMFASSYVEEEQQFWYWICSGWIFYLHVRWASSKSSVQQTIPFTKLAAPALAICLRLLRRWNQTGQKFTAEPDIARTFLPAHPAILWGLIILTYADAGYHLLQVLPLNALAWLSVLVLTVLAFVFKLNFVAADSPELLANSFLLKVAESWPASLPLVWQARVIFGGLACYAVLAFAMRNRPDQARGELLPNSRFRA